MCLVNSTRRRDFFHGLREWCPAGRAASIPRTPTTADPPASRPRRKWMDPANPQILADASARVKEGDKMLFPLFKELGWDPLSGVFGFVAMSSHIIRFVRPFFETVANLAMYKLRGACGFETDNNSQGLAVLGQRFGLDVCSGHPDSVQYPESAVASHLRICARTTEDRLWRYTIRALLSCVAANVLHSGFLLGYLEILRDKVKNGKDQGR
ncbi:hypothetical protein F5I97DRAFT_64920 [Phlebopus sp. FC_14]|nr:hypothetical protein F5I97DRAFT_64920 [Phlebopus sp. FC_14]